MAGRAAVACFHDDVTDLPSPDLAAARRARAEQADQRLRDLLEGALEESAVAPEESGVALVAVGGYGRSELSPFSDLDVVLLHDPSVSDTVVSHLAEAVWYPLWNDKVQLDHSVRDTEHMRATAREDDRAAMGMLDARCVAGDESLVTDLRSAVLGDWRTQARGRVEQVRQTRLDRIERSGSLAHSAAPDLKESAGGLRDGVVLRALVATWLIDVPQAEAEDLRAQLLDVRDALHEAAGRRLEKLTPDLVPDVAERLGLSPVDLDLHTRTLGRRVEHLSTLAWRRVDDALKPDSARKVTPKGPRTTAIDDGVALLDGEVITTRDSDAATDPELALRAAAAAARRGVPINAGTAARLARTMGDLPDPWPASSTRLLVDLLTAGPGLIPVWDELDIAGVVDRLLPEWADIRLRGSSSPVHRFTVDRHSIEAVVNAVGTARDVARPDLLAVAALLHDIGKGRDGDHSEVGAPMAVDTARRWGFSEADADVIGRLVRHHLLLPHVATTRDIEDPTTAEAVAELVEDQATLDLLRALTSADARATSPQAWSSWRRGLVDGLVDKVTEVLDDTTPNADASSYEGWPMHVPVPAVGVMKPSDFTLEIEPSSGGSLLTVVTSSRSGVMADLAGGLALAGLSVRAARTVTLGDAAVSLWEVVRPDLDPKVVAQRLKPALAGELDRSRLALPAEDDAPRVRLLPAPTETASVLEVRAHDRRGLLWSVCDAIASLGHNIRSAHLSTYGDEARDVFYVVDAAGDALDDAGAESLREGVLRALG